ncbi:MAG: HlyC/CorC family transporter [bacterium]|nr:HlyC/CorC family transporter [bacterium]MBP6770947.1 HlyC/CorC family transporter [Reyranella sp.]
MIANVTAQGTGSALVLALAAWGSAMLLSGLLAAHYRVSGLFHNGLLEDRPLGAALNNYLAHDRRFQVTIGALYLGCSLVGGWTLGRLLEAVWAGAGGVRFLLVFGIGATLIWTLGGLLLRSLAAGAALGYARVVGTIVFPLCWLLRPWAALMLVIMDRVDDTLWSADMQPHLSTGEIRSLMSDEGEDSALDEDEREMIQSIFNFHETAVREIMVPRIDVVALDGDASVLEVVPTVIEQGHSRLPVFQGSVDRVVGILYSKDLLRLVQDGRFVAAGRKVADLARPAYFIPESKKIDEVLDEFRSKRIHMAVVIDEYGGTAGLVTLEDVIEEIVGDIEDEFDEQEDLVTWLDDRTVRLDPKINLEELEEILGVTFGDAAGVEDSETLGGLVYEAAGNVPQAGEEFAVAGFSVTVEDVADQRLLRVLLRAPAAMPGFARRESE